MKTRTSEALRLEEEYLGRVRQTLAGRGAEEIDEIVQSLRDHIAEALSAEAEPIGIAAMAGVLERLGSPEDYAQEEAAQGQVQPPAPAAGAPPPLPPDELSIAGCFSDAVDMYKRNFLTLLLASVIYLVLGVVSLTVLTGPLTGGICVMFLSALHRPDRRMELGDLFKAFDRFWPLMLVTFFWLIVVSAGLVLLIVPGVLLMTIWQYEYFFIVEYKQGVLASLASSYRLVRQRWGLNLILALILLGISIGPEFLAGPGTLIGIFLMPLGWLVWCFAYIRQVRPEMAQSLTPIAT